VAHQFCYRFYGGRFGSFPVEQDRQMLDKYPDRKGPFSLALVAEAAFDHLSKDGIERRRSGDLRDDHSRLSHRPIAQRQGFRAVGRLRMPRAARHVARR